MDRAILKYNMTVFFTILLLVLESDMYSYVFPEKGCTRPLSWGATYLEAALRCCASYLK